MAEMKAGYKQTDIGVIPEDWDEALIGDLFDFKNGLNKAKEFFGYGTPIVNYMDVFNFSGLRLNNVQGKVDVTFQEKQNFSVKKGDVFFTRTSETVEDIGVASVMLDDCNETVFSGFVLRGRPKSKSIEEDYCKYCFSSDEVRKQITSKSTYTTRALTNGWLLSSVTLPLPKPEEQKQIAAALSDVDGMIESLERLITKKRNMKTAAMQQLLTGKKRLPGFDGEWKEKVVSDFGEVITGSTPSTKIPDFWHGDIPWITPTDINKKKDIAASEREISKLGLSVSRKLPVGSVLVTCIASIGKNAILRNEGACNQQINAIVPNFKYSSDFIYYLMEINKDYLIANAGITATRMISKKDFSDISFLVPKLKEQTAIAAVLSDMDTEIDALEQHLAKARNLKTGMMQELLTGKTRLINTHKKQAAA